MKRIKHINELKKGDKIIKINFDSVEIREFLCIHPHNENYSLFLDSNLDGMSKFYNPWIQDEEWYLYSDKEWNEIRLKQIEKMQSEIAYYKSLLKK